MLIHRISRGAHIFEMDRVSMALQAVQEHGMPSLIAMDLKLPDECCASSDPVRSGQTPSTADPSRCPCVNPVLTQRRSWARLWLDCELSTDPTT